MATPLPLSDDLTWRTENGVFKYRAAAIIHHAGTVLVSDIDGLSYNFLPGGKIRFGEDSRRAVEREVSEELGHDLPIGALRLVVENLYLRDGETRHELCFCYRVDWPDDLPPEAVNERAEAGHRFRWMTSAEVEDSPFQPPELVPELFSATGLVRHLLLDRRETEPST